MLHEAVFKTDNLEIKIKKESEKKWVLSVYEIQHAVKTLYEQHVVECYRTALAHVEYYYLKDNKQEVV